MISLKWICLHLFIAPLLAAPADPQFQSGGLPLCHYVQFSDGMWLAVNQTHVRCVNDRRQQGTDMWIGYQCDWGSIVKFEYAPGDQCTLDPTSTEYTESNILDSNHGSILDRCCVQGDDPQFQSGDNPPYLGCHYAQFSDYTWLAVNQTHIRCVQEGPNTWVGYQCDTSSVIKFEYAPGDQCNFEPTFTEYNEMNIIHPIHGAINDRCCIIEDTQEGPFLPPVAMETPMPSPLPTATTTRKPSFSPTTRPTTSAPTRSPTGNPSLSPTSNPTSNPSSVPTAAPTVLPTMSPTQQPSRSPSDSPTVVPTANPTLEPTVEPTKDPTFQPTTWKPTQVGETRPPTPLPTVSPTKNPTNSPTDAPSFSPTDNPTNSPTTDPTKLPTQSPTLSTQTPTINPTVSPTDDPSEAPSPQPSMPPTQEPTVPPTLVPSLLPTQGDHDDDDDQGDDDDENVKINGNKSTRAQLAAQAVRKQVMPSVPVHVLCLLFVLVLFFFLIRNFFFPSRKNADDNAPSIAWSIRVTTMVTFIANLTAIVCLLAMSVMMVTVDTWDLDMFKKVLVPYNFVSVCYIVGKASLETFFILRVYNAFKGSAFSLSKRTVGVLFAVLSLIALAWLFLLVIDQKEWAGIDRDYDYLILSSLDALFVTVLLIMFSKRLSALVLLQKSEVVSTELSSNASSHSMQRQQTTTDDGHDHDGGDIEVEMHRMASASSSPPVFNRAQTIKVVQQHFEGRQTKLIFVITRCIILAVITFLTTIIFGFFSFYYVRYGTHLYILYSAWSLDMSINLFCLYLNFVFASDVYNRCCQCFHRRAQRLVELRTAAVIVDEHVRSMETDQTHEAPHDVSTMGSQSKH